MFALTDQTEEITFVIHNLSLQMQRYGFSVIYFVFLRFFVPLQAQRCHQRSLPQVMKREAGGNPALSRSCMLPLCREHDATEHDLGRRSREEATSQKTCHCTCLFRLSRKKVLNDHLCGY